MFSIYRRLKQQGVLGINKRNGAYILPYNSRKKLPIVDDKLQTKKLAIQADIATPQLYGTIETIRDIKEFTKFIKSHDNFVIKPAHGIGGEGIIIITACLDTHYRQVNGNLLKLEDLRYHIANILAGMHSLGGYPDKALIEYCVKADPLFASICINGIPDIRVITLFGYPVMAMARLPTRLSQGKANLHQGAIGVGICLATGITQDGVWHNDAIKRHPDTLKPIAGVSIPHWHDILTIAAKCYEYTGLGYLGVDIVLDNNLGPLMLEINGRPGLNIQIANRMGLFARCKLIERKTICAKSVHDRVDFVKTTFSSDELLLPAY